MRNNFKNWIIAIFLFPIFSSCNKINTCCESDNLVTIYNFYNVTNWRPLLDKRNPQDSLLHAKLIELSSIIGELARNEIDASGGLHGDGKLMNPCAKISNVNLDEFYFDIRSIISDIKSEEKYSEVHKELNLVFQYNFFREEGSLSQANISSNNLEQVVNHLFFFENFCYYLIIKYA